MKTIELTDKMHEFLMNLSKELNTQNHRCTAMPYFFQVQTKKQIAVPEGNGIEAWYYDGSLIETKEEIEEAINEHKGWDEHTTEFNHLEEYEIENLLEEAGFSKINYDYEEVLENSFLTSRACDEHIKINNHNLSYPVNYLSHAFRNPEMEMVMKFLCELTGGKLHK
tara:strand:+ start:66 stop:566 length:501 start_codon:yes stop_codon:yes gene_type:complete